MNDDNFFNKLVGKKQAVEEQKKNLVPFKQSVVSDSLERIQTGLEEGKIRRKKRLEKSYSRTDPYLESDYQIDVPDIDQAPQLTNQLIAPDINQKTIPDNPMFLVEENIINRMKEIGIQNTLMEIEKDVIEIIVCVVEENIRKGMIVFDN